MIAKARHVHIHPVEWHDHLFAVEHGAQSGWSEQVAREQSQHFEFAVILAVLLEMVQSLHELPRTPVSRLARFDVIRVIEVQDFELLCYLFALISLLSEVSYVQTVRSSEIFPPVD